jgi:hypothetical protein
MRILPDAGDRVHDGFEPLEDVVVYPTAGKFLEYANAEQIFAHLSLTQSGHRRLPPIVLPKYGEPSHWELLAAIEPQGPTHPYLHLFPDTTENLATLVLFGACGKLGPNLAVSIG